LRGGEHGTLNHLQPNHVIRHGGPALSLLLLTAALAIGARLELLVTRRLVAATRTIAQVVLVAAVGEVVGLVPEREAWQVNSE
jgi:hypothetical protein